MYIPKKHLLINIQFPLGRNILYLFLWFMLLFGECTQENRSVTHGRETSGKSTVSYRSVKRSRLPANRNSQNSNEVAIVLCFCSPFFTNITYIPSANDADVYIMLQHLPNRSISAPLLHDLPPGYLFHFPEELETK